MRKIFIFICSWFKVSLISIGYNFCVSVVAFLTSKILFHE